MSDLQTLGWPTVINATFCNILWSLHIGSHIAGRDTTLLRRRPFSTSVLLVIMYKAFQSNLFIMYVYTYSYIFLSLSRLSFLPSSINARLQAINVYVILLASVLKTKL